MSITGRGRFNIVATDEYGNIAPGASVEIRTEPGLALATLFTNRNGTGPRANPLTADENGYAFAYAATGHYQLKLSVYGRERILRDVEIGTAAIASGDAPGLKYVFRSATNTAVNPGVGSLRLNNASPASVTQIAISFTGALASEPDYEAWLLSWATSSTLTNRGQIIIKDAANPSTYAVYRITDNTVNATTYGRFTVQHQSSHGSFVNGRDLSIEFARTGDAGSVTGGRERLTSNRTYFVRPNGNDNNTGLTDTAGGAFLTIQHAINVATLIDPGNRAVEIRVADGTYTGSTLGSMTRQMIGNVPLSIIGNVGTPTNVNITGAARCFFVGNGAVLKVSGMRLETTGSNSCLTADVYGVLEFSDVVFNGNGRANLEAASGGTLIQSGDCAISASSPRHALIYLGGASRAVASTITLTGTPAYSVAFLEMNRTGYSSFFAVTISGAATGKRYTISENCVARTGSGGPTTFFPGNVAGTTATGGQIT